MNKIPDYYASKQDEFEQLMATSNYVLSIDEHSELIIQIVKDFVVMSLERNGYCCLQHQLKLYQTKFEGTLYVDQGAIGDSYSYDNNPRMEYFKNDEVLGQLTLKDMAGNDINTPSHMQRKEMILKANQIPEKRLKLKFESVDTEELKNVEINFEGEKAIFKIGEGETNHY